MAERPEGAGTRVRRREGRLRRADARAGPRTGHPAVFAPLLAAAAVLVACRSVDAPPTPPPDPDDGDDPPARVFYTPDQLVMGADLSYVNQVLDHGGVYRDDDGARSPYAIVADHGANTARFRLWHHPAWVRTEVYDDPGVPLYGGLEDVARGIAAARAEGLEVLLDLHYSDMWADPGRQDVPAAWADITDLGALVDSVYAYTRATLQDLAADGLLPELVQVGNEINCGMLSTNTSPGFPALDVCGDAPGWAAQGAVLNAGIRAVREVAPAARIVLHIAQPENVGWWFGNMTGAGGVTDFDVIGFSYYPLWSSEPLSDISRRVAAWRATYGKDVMVVETAYPWTLQNADGYGNILGASALVPGYPATPEGQRDFMIALVREVIEGGGSGVFYWEPAWITSSMKDLWGTGSSWDNATLFDFAGEAHAGFGFYTHPYDLDP